MGGWVTSTSNATAFLRPAGVVTAATTNTSSSWGNSGSAAIAIEGSSADPDDPVELGDGVGDGKGVKVGAGVGVGNGVNVGNGVGVGVRIGAGVILICGGSLESSSLQPATVVTTASTSRTLQAGAQDPSLACPSARPSACPSACPAACPAEGSAVCSKDCPQGCLEDAQVAKYRLG